MEQHEWDFYNALYECVKVDLKNETERLKGDEKAFKDWQKRGTLWISLPVDALGFPFEIEIRANFKYRWVRSLYGHRWLMNDPNYFDRHFLTFEDKLPEIEGREKEDWERCLYSVWSHFNHSYYRRWEEYERLKNMLNSFKAWREKHGGV